MKACMKCWSTTIIAILSISVTGCIPGITWLPDSSGFVYSAGPNCQRLMLYDLAKSTQKTVLADTKAGTVMPGVSPDGKQFAVARLVHEKKQRYTLQVTILGLDGKAVQRSSVFTISEAKKANKQGEVAPTELFWAKNNKIVISAWTESGAVAIYDVKTDRIVTVQGAYAAAFGGTPFRPDGKGLLVAKENENEVQMSFVDWEGHEHPFTLRLPINESKDMQELLVRPSWFSSSWQGNKAIVSTSQIRYELDSEKLTGNFQLIAPGEPNSENLLRQRYAFPNGSYDVRVTQWTKKREDKGEEKLSRLELFDLRQKKGRTIRENRGLPILFPSPDGKHVAVRWLIDNKDGKDSIEFIWVIDQTGKVVADFKVSQ